MIGNNFKIEVITESNKIKQVLLSFDSYFPRALSERIANLDNYAQKLADNSVFYIVTLEDKIIGFAACYCNEILTKQAFLTQIAVHDEYRRLYLGSKLLEFCIEKARRLGMEKLLLEVDDDNVSAHKFYAKLGFTNPQKASDHSHFLEKFL